MSSEQKVIKINQDIFNIGRRGKNTRKNKDFQSSSPNNISPLKNMNNNSLRKKLLERLEKNRQTTFSIPTKSLQSHSSILSNKQKVQHNNNNNNNNNFSQPLNEELDMPETSELDDSIKYLTELSKMTKIKKSNDMNNIITSPTIKYKVDNQVGYGCLKKGIKPCYRTWMKTVKNTNTREQNYPYTNNNIINNNNNNINRQNQSNMLSLSLKEEKLKNIRKKLVDTIHIHKNNLSQIPIISPIQFTEPINQKYDNSFIDNNNDLYQHQLNNNNNNRILFEQSQHNHQPLPEQMPLNVQQPIYKLNHDYDFEEKIASLSLPEITSTIPMIKTIKRVVKKKYTLGKNIKKRKVGLLIKNSQTRKNIMLAHKELKVKPLHDVKKYLREHGLIRVGSSCPQDCLRKIYESSKLSGDITNTNIDNIIHNILQGDE